VPEVSLHISERYRIINITVYYYYIELNKLSSRREVIVTVERTIYLIVECQEITITTELLFTVELE